MPTCKKCGSKFPSRMEINGKIRMLNKRTYCLKCSPFGMHNTKQLHVKNKGKKRGDHNKQQMEMRKYRKEMLIDLLGESCEICKYNKCHASLCFHHVNPKDKRFDVGTNNLTNHNIDQILNEVKKTVLLCLNCHGEVHQGMHAKVENEWGVSLRDRNRKMGNKIRQRGGNKIFRRYRKNHYEIETKRCVYCKEKFKARNIEHKFCSMLCSQLFSRKVKNRPSKKALEKMILTMSWKDIGRKYDISEAVVRKWAKQYDLDRNAIRCKNENERYNL